MENVSGNPVAKFDVKTWMRISYIYHFDASSPSIQSGRPASILEALENMDCEVQRIFPLRDDYRMLRWAQKVFWHSLGRQYLFDREPRFSGVMRGRSARSWPRKAETFSSAPARWRSATCKVISRSPFARTPASRRFWISTLLTPKLSPFLRRTAEASARPRRSGRAALAVYPSEWAATGGNAPLWVAGQPRGGDSIWGKSGRTEHGTGGVRLTLPGAIFKTVRLLIRGPRMGTQGRRHCDRRGPVV